MIKYKKIYCKHYGYGEQDRIMCEYCFSVGMYNDGVDLHHILFKSRGGKDNIENLICLCRACHNLAHESKIFNNKLKELKSKEFET
jgi:5-methylcytosine-specific restriction endonuclease McrA